MIKKIICITILSLLLTSSTSVEAGVITGETALAGFSKLMQDAGYIYPEGIELLAQVMYHENYANGEEVMYYTGAVVMNRVRHKGFPNTVKEVLYQKNPVQYSTTSKFFTVQIPESVYHLAVKVAKGTPDVPDNVIYQAMFMQGSGLWKHEKTEYFCYE